MVWLTLFVAALVGSVHCVGMCGPLCAMASHSSDRRSSFMRFTTYQAGRLTSYRVLGAVAGTLGAAFNLGGAWMGWQQAATWIAGASMILLSLVAVGRLLIRKPTSIHLPAFVNQGIARVRPLVMKLPPNARAMALGGVTGLLPCGWLYAFVILSAGAGSALGGATLMGVFWLGSVPALGLVVISAQWLLRRAGSQVQWMVPMLMGLVGVLMISERTGWSIDELGPKSASEASKGISVEAIEDVASEVPPCCRAESED